jgi:hypothetical protein
MSAILVFVLLTFGSAYWQGEWLLIGSSLQVRLVEMFIAA